MKLDKAERIVDQLDARADQVLVLTYRRSDLNELAARLDAGGRDTACLLVAYARRAVVA